MNATREACGADPIGSIASGVTVNWRHNAHAGAIDRALFVFTEIGTGNQTRYEVAPNVHTCIPLVAGAYRVSVIAAGLERYRDTLDLRPGRPTTFSPLLQASNEKGKTLTDVLKRLEVDESLQRRDLVVPANSRVVLDSTDENFREDWQEIKVADVLAAKRILGNGDENFPGALPRFPAQAKTTQSQPRDLAVAAAREYIYGNSASVKNWPEEINNAVFNEVWKFAAFILGTVTINAGGVLVVGTNSNFFICELLRMHVTATLLIRGVGPIHVEPLAIETFC